MRKVTVLFAVLVFAATTTAALALIQRHREAARALPVLEKTTRVDARFEYDVMAGPKIRTFNLDTDVTLKRPDSTARVVFHFADPENHHYVEFRPRAIEVVVVRNSIGRVLETVEDVALPVGRPFHVLIKRRAFAIRVAVDDVVLAVAYDETFLTGKVGYASAAGEADFTPPKVQSIAEIYFADDFMRAENEKGPWTELHGDWRVNALTHPSMSANAFQYIVGREGGAAVAGYSFWDDYSFAVAVKPQRRATFGLYFYYRDENNYFRFEWTPEETGHPGSGEKRLIRRWHGEETVVARLPGGFKLNQWYTLKCELSGQRVRTSIDENLIFDHRDARLSSGMVGLYASAESRTYFDDVFVRSYDYFEDRFINGVTGAWSFMGGRWSRQVLGNGQDAGDASTLLPASPARGILRVSSPEGEARAAVGSAAWKNYVLETEIHPDTSGHVGVVLYYQDETRYYQVSRRCDGEGRETWTLERVLDDNHQVLDEKTLEEQGGSRRVRAGIRDGYISVAVNGRKLLEGFDLTLRHGRPGLFAEKVAVASFGPVKVDWPLEPPPLLTLNEIFEHEKSMADWSSIESDWQWTSNGLWLNKGNFPGDAAIETEITSLSGPDAELGLLLSTDGDGRDSGYLLKLAAGADDAPIALALLRKGERAASLELSAATDLRRFGLKRQGSYLVGSVNGKPVLVYRDREPLEGDGLGWYSRKVKVDTRSVSVSSPNVRKYLFRRAHTDWRVVRGTWEVTSRWQCDDRWTFFSGRSYSKLAAIWNKRKLQGDVTLDFYVGPKMDRDRGDRYQYASDFNCTLAGNGIDLTSGYSFLFGGFGNSKTVLMRGDRIVAEARWAQSGPQTFMQKDARVVIPSRQMNIHRKWFHVKAQKKGDRLRLWIEDQLVIDYTDESPLTGDRVALWTWSNGIMVARVTVVGEDTGEIEGPDAYQPTHCRTAYDVQTVAGR